MSEKLSITKNYEDDTTHDAAELDAFFESIETFINTTKVGGSVLQVGAITTDKFIDDAVTADKIATNTIESRSIQDEAITSDKIKDTDRGAIAPAAKPALLTGMSVDGTDPGEGKLVASPSISFTHTGNTSWTNVTNGTVELTCVTTRPVLIFLVPDGSASPAKVTTSGNHSHMQIAGLTQQNQPTGDHKFPSFFVVDVSPAEGLNTYELQVKLNNGADTVGVTNCKLVAFQI